MKIKLKPQSNYCIINQLYKRKRKIIAYLIAFSSLYLIITTIIGLPIFLYKTTLLAPIIIGAVITFIFLSVRLTKIELKIKQQKNTH